MQVGSLLSETDAKSSAKEVGIGVVSHVMYSTTPLKKD